jgi:hypothetical protein
MTVPMALDEVILMEDRRGIGALAPFVPPYACRRSAERLLNQDLGNVIIVTGFYVIESGVIETDGPPGALAMGRALTSLGYHAIYDTDRFAAPFLESEVSSDQSVVEFPITPADESAAFARAVVSKWQPVALIAVERCGVTIDGRYLDDNAVHGPHRLSFRRRTDNWSRGWR